MQTRKLTRYVALTAFLLVAGCAAGDKALNTSFAPVKTEGGFAYYRYRAPADSIHPVDTENGEAYRMYMLSLYLDDFGYGRTKPEIVERRAVLKDHRLLTGDSYDVHYVIRVPVAR